VVGQRHVPAALPPGKTRYPLYRRLVGLRSRSGTVQKISHPLGLDPWTVQRLASRYTGQPIVAVHVIKALWGRVKRVAALTLSLSTTWTCVWTVLRVAAPPGKECSAAVGRRLTGVPGWDWTFWRTENLFPFTGI